MKYTSFDLRGTLRADAFRVQVENGFENIFFLLFHRFQSRFDIHSFGQDHTGGYASSQASEGYKLKAECYF